jgi:hypothetical protein
MSNLAKSTRQLLIDNFHLPRLTRVAEQVSQDGSRKYLLGLQDGKTYRDCADATPRSSYGVCLLSGRLRNGLLFLRDRQNGTDQELECW